MLDRVTRTLERHRMIPPGVRVGVAVSGGADSVCLLHVLRELGIPLSILHLNHMLRGAESDGDAEFVRGLADQFGLPAYIEHADVAASEDNLEQAGRAARRAFFERILASGEVGRIATGHTRSDQAETVLYRLLRGAGTTGLSGIRPVTSDGIIRPLIECTRADVLDYLRERGLTWREDRTNADPAFVRNRIRHELIPFIERDFSPAASAILAATAEIARDEEAYWACEIDRLVERLLHVRDGAVLISAANVQGLPIAVARRLIRRAIEMVKGDLRRIDIAHVERILELAGQPEGHGRLQAPGIDVFRSFEWLRVGPPRTHARAEDDYAFTVERHFPQRIPLPSGAVICLELLEHSGPAHPAGGYNRLIGDLDLDRVTGPLELRNWHPGDEFQSPGKAPAKIKFLFQEGRVPIWERQRWPVLLSGRVTIWTRRFGAAGEFAANPQTRRVLRVYEIGPEDSRESIQPARASK